MTSEGHSAGKSIWLESDRSISGDAKKIIDGSVHRLTAGGHGHIDSALLHVIAYCGMVLLLGMDIGKGESTQGCRVVLALVLTAWIHHLFSDGVNAWPGGILPDDVNALFVLKKTSYKVDGNGIFLGI